jgi:8-oxo-dGTP pyrophosphatase MutT (NUDIX family)
VRRHVNRALLRQRTDPVSGFTHLGDREVHRGHVWSVVVGSFSSPDGIVFERDIVRSPGAVGIVPVLYDPEGHPSVVLVRQYRPSCGFELIEIPAGMRDVPGEPTESTAHRELAEEVGLAADSMTRIARFHPSPGMTDSTTEIFLATGCEPIQRDLQGPEEEHMTELHLPLADALALIDNGTITDAKTVIGLRAAADQLRRADDGA